MDGIKTKNRCFGNSERTLLGKSCAIGREMAIHYKKILLPGIDWKIYLSKKPRRPRISAKGVTKNPMWGVEREPQRRPREGNDRVSWTKTSSWLR